MKVDQAVAQIRAKDDEIQENLKAFYGEDLLEILMEAANLYNAARLAHMAGQRDLGRHLREIAAHIAGPVARLSKKDPKDVARDMMAIANARVAMVKK